MLFPGFPATWMQAITILPSGRSIRSISHPYDFLPCTRTVPAHSLLAKADIAKGYRDSLIRAENALAVFHSPKPALMPILITEPLYHVVESQDRAEHRVDSDTLEPLQP